MKITERFLKYVSYGTNSDEDSISCPSTPVQLELGKYIAGELKDIGLEIVRQDENGYVYGFLPGKGALKDLPAVGFISHLDTSPSVRGDGIRPEMIEYIGGDITLVDGQTVITVKDNPALVNMTGEHIIVTDGQTLLGADDKAGVAEIVTLCEELAAGEESHRPLAICFTPDEEIGRGADRFDRAGFAADVAYTVDGGALGEIEYENFNAASLRLTVNGVNIHPGNAKGRMKNAVLMANEFISMLPEAEQPAHTEGYEGFYHVTDISGNETLCVLKAIIRDHDREKFEARKRFILRLCDYLNSVWGENSFVPEINDSYYNMKEKILPHMYLIDNARAAFIENGIEPKCVPIRGGTDGARLSYEGLPCPNLSTGGYNFHSCKEFITVEAMEKMVKVLKSIATRV
ncbi:MAG: peptidase T [Clostridia bacterium]|nr:peptidase T [Clostridia bacterium]